MECTKHVANRDEVIKELVANVDKCYAGADGITSTIGKITNMNSFIKSNNREARFDAVEAKLAQERKDDCNLIRGMSTSELSKYICHRVGWLAHEGYLGTYDKCQSTINLAINKTTNAINSC